MPFRCIPPYILAMLDARRPFDVSVDNMYICQTPSYVETAQYVLRFDGEKIEVSSTSEEEDSNDSKHKPRIDDHIVNLIIDLRGSKIQAPLWIELKDGMAYCFGNGDTLECHVLPVKLDKHEDSKAREHSIDGITVIFLDEKGDNKTAYFAARGITWLGTDDMVKLEGATIAIKPETFRRLIEVTDNGKKMKIIFEARNLDSKKLGTLTELLEALAFLKL